jgi:hypothetical protein
MKIEKDVEVFKYLQPYYKWNMISFGICDRILMVNIENNCIGHDLKTVTDYLTSNYFFKDEVNGVFCRFKFKSGDYVTPNEFDKKYHFERKEMIDRMLNIKS